MNWKPGDRALCVNCSHPENESEICTVLGPMVPGFAVRWGGEYIGWPVSLPSGRYVAHPSQPKPIDDDYDGHQVTTWDKCVWQPAVTVQ